MAKPNLGDAPAHVAELVEETPEPRVRIILENNPNIPPTGQFFGVNGTGYIIRPGEEVNVPESVLEVLNNAIESTPVTDTGADGGTVVGYRDKLRFSYRLVQPKK